MDIQVERKTEVNRWLIRVRWFYMTGILAIGIITRLISNYTAYFAISKMFVIYIAVFLLNLFLYLAIRNAEKNTSRWLTVVISYAQVIIELAVSTIITHYAGGIESVTLIFYFLPVVSSALLFGLAGAVATSIVAGLCLNILVFLEFNGVIPHINRFGVESIEFANLSLTLAKSLTLAIFYFVIGVISGYGAQLIIRREQMYKENSEQLEKESRYRKNEWEQLDKTTKLLVKRDLELTAINKELDKKIKDLERSEMAMLKAFADLKEERKKFEEERNKTSAIVANLIDPIIVIDKDSRISLFNPAAKSVFGFIDTDIGREVLSKNNYSMENFKAIVKQDYKVFQPEDRETGIEEEVIINYAGQEVTYKVITAAVVDQNNKNLGIMKVFYNLTREKMLDKLKSEFISIAAHQLRTPLSAIKWVIKMVLDGDVGPLNKEQEELLFKGYRSNERIINLVNDMLNVSRIEEGRFGYSFNKEDFTEILKESLENIDTLVKNKKIKVELKQPKELPRVYMDRQKMFLVLQNLLENAVKYTPEMGKINIDLEAGDKFLQVKIKDNGVGIPKEDREKLFTKFFRASNVVRMQTEGSGLGLFIVKNIIKKHGGEITCNSEEGMGTEFIFTLPLSKEDINDYPT